MGTGAFSPQALGPSLHRPGQAGSQEQSSVYAQMLAQLCRQHVSSGGCTTFEWWRSLKGSTDGGRERGREEGREGAEKRGVDKEVVASSIYHFFFKYLSFQPFFPLTPSSYLDMSLSFYFRQASVYLILSLPLSGISLSIFHLLSRTLSDESVYLRKRNLICLGRGGGGMSSSSTYLHSAIFSVMITNIKKRSRGRKKKKLLQKSFELFTKHKAEMQVSLFFSSSPGRRTLGSSGFNSPSTYILSFEHIKHS